jgi:hypothetical protein
MKKVSELMKVKNLTLNEAREEYKKTKNKT